MENLKKLRKGRKMSKDVLATLINVSKSSVEKYERGEREPSISTLKRLSEIFGVSVDYLIGNVQENTDANVRSQIITEGKSGLFYRDENGYEYHLKKIEKINAEGILLLSCKTRLSLGILEELNARLSRLLHREVVVLPDCLDVLGVIGQASKE